MSTWPSSTTSRASAHAPTRWWRCARTSAAAKGEQALLDEVRYYFYITTYTDLTATEIVTLANERCDQENVIGDLKSGIGALRVPLYDLVSNWAYMVIAALAFNLKSWFALTMHRKADRHAYIRMEFRRFFHSVILIPAMVGRRARGITVRLIGYTPASIDSSAHGPPSNDSASVDPHTAIPPESTAAHPRRRPRTPRSQTAHPKAI